jgi:ABC-type Na+ transport system ATPase subunit NatA
VEGAQLNHGINAVIHDGRLQFTGTPAELRDKTGQEYLERAFLKTIETSTRVYES